MLGSCPVEHTSSLSERSGISLTWRQCLLANQPMCWSCCGSGRAEANRNAFKVRAANAECKALNQTFASVLSAALSQHSWTPSGECSSRIRPSTTKRRKKKISSVLWNEKLSHVRNYSFKLFVDVGWIVTSRT